MKLIQSYTIYIIVVLTANATSHNHENDHLCEVIVTRLTDDGHTHHDKILVCCPGYIVDTMGKCIPLCERPCIFGFCKAPNVCECIDGYKMINNECVPICRNRCVNGYCSKPNQCGCLNGFELDMKNLTYCIPVCRPKCKNFSKCTKLTGTNRNRCQCITGYTENKETGICEPNCKNKCHNGFCSAPETCGCFKGFELNNDKTKCIPKCEPKCPLHSSCNSPNTCNCNEGYVLSELSKQCQPICQDIRENSRCVAPPNTWVCNENYQLDSRIDKCVLDSCLCNSNGYCTESEDICECYDDFSKNSITGQCEPICHPKCENANCVANNVCQCHDGYHKTPQDHICEQNDICIGRPCKNGECLITGECKCKAGYVQSFSYNGQLQCDNVQAFIGKVMTMILGVVLVLTACAFIGLYCFDQQKSYKVEEQEMMLIERR